MGDMPEQVCQRGEFPGVPVHSRHGSSAGWQLADRLAVRSLSHSFLGTPYQHQGRLPGVALDCYGVVFVAYQMAGHPMQARHDYSMQPTEVELYAWMDEHFDRIALDECDVGDVLVFAMVREAQHMAIVTATSPIRMVHAYLGVGKVVEHDLVAPWTRLLRSVHRFKGWA